MVLGYILSLSILSTSQQLLHCDIYWRSVLIPLNFIISVMNFHMAEIRHQSQKLLNFKINVRLSENSCQIRNLIAANIPFITHETEKSKS